MKKLMWVFISILILIIIGIIIVVCINAYVTGYSEPRIKTNYEDFPKVGAILVLGCEVKDDGSLSLMLRDRLNKGIEAYQNGISSKIIVSGDNRSESNTEVNVMKQYLLDNQVKEEDIIMDSAGYSTYDSMYRLKEIFHVDKCVIITQKYHLYRAIYIGSQLGIDSYGIASEGDQYDGQWVRDFREVLARNKDFVKCIFRPEASSMEQ